MNRKKMKDFFSIAQYVIEQGPHDGSTKDIFKMALWAYEDEYGEPTEAEAQEFYDAFVTTLQVVNEGLLPHIREATQWLRKLRG